MDGIENFSIFDLDEESGGPKVDNTLDVVKLDYIEAESLSWRELFSGFDTLKAITFSSGISFVYELVKLFKQVEIIFGCEDVMSASIHDIMAYQGKIIERLRNSAGKEKEKLLKRIDATLIQTI